MQCNNKSAVNRYDGGGTDGASIGHKCFNPILILISALALSISAAACGGSGDKPADEDTDSGVVSGDGGVINECEAAGHFGPNCGECTGNYWGPNCDQDTITCKHGTPAVGVHGNGQCASCEANTGWSGDNCDECTGNYWGANCDKAPTCEHGTPSLGLNGTGKCTSCQENTGWTGDNCNQCGAGWTGENCNFEKKCVHGTLDPETGHCAADSCEPNFAGPDCNKCANTLMTGANCDECTIADKTIGSLTDTRDNKSYKTTAINCRKWMAESMALQDEEEVTCNFDTAKDPDYIKKYGCLYNLNDAVKACPAGWRLPTKEEFDDLLAYAGEHKTSSNVFLSLIAKTDAWKSYQNQGGDDFGFGAMPTGWWSSEINDFSNVTFLWSSSTKPESSANGNYALLLGYNTASLDQNGPKVGLSVRCIMESAYQDCSAGHFGENCGECTCKHGICKEGRDGDGQCSSCDAGWDGPNCDQCASGWLGANCDIEKKCSVHGELNPETGHCISGSCEERFAGRDCDECSGKWTGANCNVCNGGYGDNCAEFDSITDGEGNKYNIVGIGNHVWTAENMAMGSNPDKIDLGTITCHANIEAVPDFVKNYGCLYVWNDAKRVCPSGWHLPTKEEFEYLLAHVGGPTAAGAKNLMAESWGGQNTYHFGALPAGFWEDGTYDGLGSTTSFWTSTESDETAFDAAWELAISKGTDGTARAGMMDDKRSRGKSVRCIKDYTCDEGWLGVNCDIRVKCAHGTLDQKTGHCVSGTCTGLWTGSDCDECSSGYGENCTAYGSVKDIENNVYKTVIINGREWMAENYKRKRKTVDHVPHSQAYLDYTYPNGNQNNMTAYGLLYDWDTASGGNFCPSGWRLPTKAEYEALLNTASFPTELMDKSWKSGLFNNGIDTYGFAAVPAGYYRETYLGFGEVAAFWTSDASTDSEGWGMYLNRIPVTTSVSSVKMDMFVSAKTSALSVRCIKK